MLVFVHYTDCMKNIKTLFIDLDGTVYNKYNGMWEEMTARIDRYMHDVLGIPQDKILPTREKYYNTYGSTLRGIQMHHTIDSEDFLAYVHDIDLTQYLKPDPALRQALESIPQPKWIFTNSDRNHSARVLRILGLEDIFEGILDVWAMHYVPKPSPWVYKHAMALTGNNDPQTCMFIDDTLKNLGAPQKMGFTTVWIDEFSTQHRFATHVLPQLHQLPALMETITKSARVAGFTTMGTQLDPTDPGLFQTFAQVVHRSY